ncbi:hypothetical protein HYH03_004254 [Edaphochlamys debaryana]|uniref:START domain-containing protein n=1 Tax=Edaphochlamys debaryana TaxID=47281 RepID=A0A836C2P3_9CHLO|nr:hypothetical protein HYH03_004254 [Edaphochlamys debaryana]|eukprot:KAG2497995.1 hypothetical protein HYH03_004254 [Edaphochlamys debaryana]
METLLKSGLEVVAAAKAKGVPIDTLFSTSPAAALSGAAFETHEGNAVDPPGTLYGYGSKPDEATQCHCHIVVREFAAPLLHLVTLIREFDLGKLAGDLKSFTVTENTPERVTVEYTSILPWPFEPRWIRATMRYGVLDSGAVVILGESVPGASPPAGSTLGTVHYSFYHISPAGPSKCVLRRAICVDMHLPLPAFVIRKSLAAHYASDMALIDKDVGAAWESSGLAERLAKGACYRAMEQALAKAAGK